MIPILARRQVDTRDSQANQSRKKGRKGEREGKAEGGREEVWLLRMRKRIGGMGEWGQESVTEVPI